jgi:hypothetical protein
MKWEHINSTVESFVCKLFTCTVMGSIVCVSPRDIEMEQETFRNTKFNQELFASAMWKEEDPDSIHNDLLCLRWSDQNCSARATRKNVVVFVDSTQDQHRKMHKSSFQRSCNSLMLNTCEQMEGQVMSRCRSCNNDYASSEIAFNSNAGSPRNSHRMDRKNRITPVTTSSHRLQAKQCTANRLQPLPAFIQAELRSINAEIPPN